MARLEELGAPAKYLNAELSEIREIVPVGWLERRLIRKMFKRESITRGPDLQWLSRTWELRLGAVNELIYKVGVESVAKNLEDAEDLTAELFSFLPTLYGTPELIQEGIFLWTANDGNVVMQLANVEGERRVMLFLTTSYIQDAPRL
jgi:hypothetical protein